MADSFQSHSKQLSRFEQQRLEKQRDALQAEWQLRTDKLTALRKALVIEAAAHVQFQLNQLIQSEQEALQPVESQLSSIEQALAGRIIPASMDAQHSEAPEINGIPRGKHRKSFDDRQITQLETELAAVEADLASAPRQVDRLRLENLADQLLNKLEALQKKRDAL